MAIDVTGLPGADLVERGLADLMAGVESAEALLVSIGHPRLEQAGIRVDRTPSSPEERLYRLLEERHGDEEAHSRYNALVRRLVSFERAVERARSANPRIC